MFEKNRITGKFKLKGENILRNHQPRPGSMEDFLKYTQNHNPTITRICKSSEGQFHNQSNAQNPKGAKTQIVPAPYPDTSRYRG